MISTDIMKHVKLCSNDRIYAIMLILNKSDGLMYGVLQEVLGMKDSSLLAYHTRKLMRAGLISHNKITHAYHISKKGESILKIIDTLSEKYITENETCQNSDDLTHMFVSICSKCGTVKKE